MFSHSHVALGGATSLIALRVLMGISQGPIIPACLNLFSWWIPLTERCTIVSMAYGGITVKFGTLYSSSEYNEINLILFQIGTIAGTLASGLLIHHFGTWHSSFYFFGIMAIIWFFFFVSKIPPIKQIRDSTFKELFRFEIL